MALFQRACLSKTTLVTPELVTQWKESLMTIKETNFHVMLKPECIRFIRAHWIIEWTMDTLAGEFAICQIIMDSPPIGKT
jgi:hypothetical protein